MALTLCVLASGSSGNSIYVSSDRTRILIDAGLSGREIDRRLDAIGVSLGEIRAVCVTHEHDDHRSALGVLHRRAGADVYANSGTIQALERAPGLAELPWRVFTTGAKFDVGDLQVEPFSVPHDSYDPVGFVVSCDAARIGVVTDMGMATGLIRERLRHCQVVVVEANHDTDLLKQCDRPWSLKQRIAGRQGHLSNADAGELIADIAGPQLTTAFLAHLSADCNRPELALRTVQRALARRGCGPVAVKLTYPDRVSEVVRTP
jgi:phosphoribosyl 1,2-cyclic phosphodiesterase